MSAPLLSIVVIPLLGGDALERTLRSIAPLDVSCLVIGRSAQQAASAGGAAATYIASDLSVPERRALGVAATSTPWVALVEDTCDLGPGWAAACAEIARDDSASAAGGPVSIDPALPPRCVALGCMEYAAFAPVRGMPASGAATERIAGLALLYKRAALPPLAAGQGLIESEVNDLIRRRGGHLLRHPGLAVAYRGADLDSATLASRFSHGRIYGGGLHERLGLAQRVVAALKCLALPAVMVARAARGLPAACHEPWATRLWILALSVAWSAGEGVGVLAGRGQSLARWA